MRSAIPEARLGASRTFSRAPGEPMGTYLYLFCQSHREVSLAAEIVGSLSFINIARNMSSVPAPPAMSRSRIHALVDAGS